MEINARSASGQPSRRLGKLVLCAYWVFHFWWAMSLFWLGVNLFSCSAQQVANNKVSLVEQGDHESRLALEVGDTLVVRLPVQMGTGYTWQNISSDSTHLALIDEVVLDQEAGAQLGGAELQRFRYHVLVAGNSRVEFHYLQPWEKEVAPAKVYRIYVESGQ